MQRQIEDSDSFVKLRSLLAEHRESGCRKYPSKIKKACLQHLAAGHSVELLASELMLPPSILYSWKKKAPNQVAVTEAKPRVLPILTNKVLPPAVLRFEIGCFSIQISQVP